MSGWYFPGYAFAYTKMHTLVKIDSDVAMLYDVAAGDINKAVKNNLYIMAKIFTAYNMAYLCRSLHLQY